MHARARARQPALRVSQKERKPLIELTFIGETYKYYGLAQLHVHDSRAHADIAKLVADSGSFAGELPLVVSCVVRECRMIHTLNEMILDCCFSASCLCRWAGKTFSSSIFCSLRTKRKLFVDCRRASSVWSRAHEKRPCVIDEKKTRLHRRAVGYRHNYPVAH